MTNRIFQEFCSCGSNMNESARIQQQFHFVRTAMGRSATAWGDWDGRGEATRHFDDFPMKTSIFWCSTGFVQCVWGPEATSDMPGIPNFQAMIYDYWYVQWIFQPAMYIMYCGIELHLFAHLLLDHESHYIPKKGGWFTVVLCDPSFRIPGTAAAISDVFGNFGMCHLVGERPSERHPERHERPPKYTYISFI